MIDQEQVLEILHAIGEKITEEKLYLTELDNVIGDGDHGINLARGFAEVEKKRPMMEGKEKPSCILPTEPEAPAPSPPAASRRQNSAR